MIIQSQKIKINWGSRNKRYYESKGYIYTKIYNEFEIDIKDLSLNSQLQVKCICDHCAQEYKAKYLNVAKSNNHVCKKCAFTKSKETNLKKYGVENVSQLKEIKAKKIQTCLKNHGVENISQSEEIKNKKIQTCLKNHGVEYGMQSEDIKNKTKKTNLKKYGVENAFQIEEIKNMLKDKYGNKGSLSNKEVRDKIKKTNLAKYGVECTLQSEDIKNKIKITLLKKYKVDNAYKINVMQRIEKANITMYKNGTGACSQQQKYICDLYGIKPNYPIGQLKLDIAFPEEMLYIEYDGSGHDLSVTMYNYSREKFNFKEFKRKKFLENKGWKLIRIISKYNYLPSDDIIFSLIQECKDYLFNENHSWIIIDIDKSEIRSSKLNKVIELGELRKIKEK